VSFRAWSINVLVAAVATGCAIRAPRMHSFVLEINGPTPGDFEGSYTAATGKNAKNAKEVRFQSADFAQRPIVIRARARTFAYQLPNNGNEAMKVKLVVDGKDNGDYGTVPPGQFWAGKYGPGETAKTDKQGP
jgi:hypothetical protein